MRFRQHIQNTPHTVGLLSTSDQLDAETATLTTHTTHNRPTSMFRRGFEPAIPASEGPQTHALDRAGAGFGKNKYKYKKKTYRSFYSTAC